MSGDAIVVEDSNTVTNEMTIHISTAIATGIGHHQRPVSAWLSTRCSSLIHPGRWCCPT